MSQPQIELEKGRITVRAEIERERIEQEVRFRELEINRQSNETRER